MKKPKVTFLMIAYNTEKYVKKAVDSVLNQSERDINLIVRNNGSTDGTGEILRKIAKSDPRVHLFENKKNWIGDDYGPFGKDGIIRIWPLEDRTLLGEYVSIVDSDDWLEPSLAKRMYRAAKEIDADITVCGSFFIKGEMQRVGERLPPDITTGDLRSKTDIIRGCFPELYNSFRTWWAKLFRTEFFLEHYDEAWRGPGGEYGNAGVLDTVHMLRYLTRSKGFVAVTQSLYNFRMSAGSSYSGRYPSYRDISNAEVLFNAGMDAIRELNIETLQNSNFIFQLNWAYIQESLQGLKVLHKNSPARRELSFIAATLNNSMLANFNKIDEATMWNTMGEYAGAVLDRNKGDFSLYSSFIVRIMFLEKMLEKNPENPLLFTILTGCLYDRENRSKVGLRLLEKVNIPQGYRELFGYLKPTYHLNMRLEPQYFDFIYNFSPKMVDSFHEIPELEDKLSESMREENYETACDILEQLLIKNPLSRNAMYYRIQLCVLAEDFEFAAVLAGTAVSMWPTDVEMQLLCWNVLEIVLPKQSESDA